MRILRLIEFICFYIKEVVLANVRVAFLVLSPKLRVNPAILAIEVAELTPRQRWILANLITMTPGTLSLDIDEKEARLFIHCMAVKDPAGMEKEIENAYVRRVCRVF